MDFFEVLLITFEIVMSFMLIGLFADKFERYRRGY
jgi:hypothetical protein